MEVFEVISALQILAGTPQDKGNAVLDKLSSTNSGRVVKHVISQTYFWREAEKRARQSCIAFQEYGPEISSLEEQFKQKAVPLQKLPQIAQRLSTWHDGLGEGCAASKRRSKNPLHECGSQGQPCGDEQFCVA